MFLNLVVGCPASGTKRAKIEVKRVFGYRLLLDMSPIYI